LVVADPVALVVRGERVVAPYGYGGALAEAIKRLKYGDAPWCARPLGRLLARAIGPLLPLFDRVVPVPLHPRRLAQRGFNQVVELLRSARIRKLADPRSAKLTGRSVARVDLGALRRVRHDPPQARGGAGARALGPRGAFVARPSRVAGRHVLLVDDVLTTGATAMACGDALRAAGASSVLVLTLARVVA
jgi:ComF family protein